MALAHLAAKETSSKTMPQEPHTPTPAHAHDKRLLQFLSERLTSKLGKGFTARNLWHMRQFYETFPNMHALRAQLSWTHCLLMRIPSSKRREWYMNEAALVSEALHNTYKKRYATEKSSGTLYEHASGARL